MVHIYIPQIGELLVDVITVATSIDFNSDGRFSDQSRETLLDYIKKQIPEITHNAQIWQEIKDSIEI